MVVENSLGWEKRYIFIFLCILLQKVGIPLKNIVFALKSCVSARKTFTDKTFVFPHKTFTVRYPKKLPYSSPQN